jgi:tRNA 2-selenouridine synthase
VITALSASDFLHQSKLHLTLDVRSEGEYKYGHIPHALNLPLFNNEERKIVGTAYKQQSREQAMLLGLDIVGKKMSGFVQHIKPLVKDNKVFVHCWRGGMRSGSMAWLFDLFGYEVYTLKGGYKAYRHVVLEALAQSNSYIVVGGKTGSGKTAVLHQLSNMGEQVIDLEAFANHKGSAFGMLGQAPQPSTEHFENQLHLQLSQFDLSKRIWLEDESKKIGTVVLNDSLWQHLKVAPLYLIELPQEIRVKRLVEEYGANQKEGLKQSLTNIKKRLGGLEWKEAMEALEQNNLAKTASIALNYYDKTYDYSITQRESESVKRFAFETDDVIEIAKTIAAN